MSINTLCATFRRFTVGKINIPAVTRYYSIQQSIPNIKAVSRSISNNYDVLHNTELAHSIKFVPRTLNIDFSVPTNGDLIRDIIQIPFKRIPPLQEPLRHLPIEYDSPVPQTTILDLPMDGNVFEKQAVRLIRIRHKKMKKHQRKKLRKKMKFEWAKIRLRRSQRKYKEFHAELIAKIKDAEAFDAKEYVKQRLNILNKEIIPRTYRGEILPVEMIKQFLEEKRAAKAAKRNKPRLTL